MLRPTSSGLSRSQSEPFTWRTRSWSDARTTSSSDHVTPETTPDHSLGGDAIAKEGASSADVALPLTAITALVSWSFTLATRNRPPFIGAIRPKELTAGSAASDDDLADGAEGADGRRSGGDASA